eukprot:236230_1
MGSSATKEAQSNSTADEDSNLKPIADEIALKKTETTMLFVGSSNSGKTTIINNIVDNYASTLHRNKFIRSRYDLELFTIREYTDPSIPHYSSSSFKYLQLINKYSELICKQTKHISSYKIAKHIMSLESTNESLFRNGVFNSKYDEILVFGFFRCYIGKHIHFPMDLKLTILMFYASCKSIVISYKFKIDDKVYNLWDTSSNDFVCGNVAQLYPWIDDVIFVLDATRFNEKLIGSNFHTNMMEYDIKLFKSMADDINANYNGPFLNNVNGEVMVILNKKDKLKEKLEKMSIEEFKASVGDTNCDDLNRYLVGFTVICEILANIFGGRITNNDLHNYVVVFAEHEQILIDHVQGNDINDVRKLFEWFQ